MTDTSPEPTHHAWVREILGGGELTEVKGLRDGGAPWLVTVGDVRGPSTRAVLRVSEGLHREVLGMTLATRGGIPAPRVLGAQTVHGVPLLLIDYLDGSGAQPLEPDPMRLRALGAVAAAIFAAPLDADLNVRRAPDTDGRDRSDAGGSEEPNPMVLPMVEHPIPLVDFTALRAEADPQLLMVEAEHRVAERHMDDPLGFVHGDLWSGNTLWRDDSLHAVLDWDCCGRGPAGVDLGSLRCDAAMSYGVVAAHEVLAGWGSAAGRPADSVAYWDIVAALSTPPDISWFTPAISGMTHRPDLTASVLRERRDAFLADALERLG